MRPSFTRSAQDILDMRAELERHNCHSIRIIAKIENSDGVENIDDIIRVSDGIMVAREIWVWKLLWRKFLLFRRN